jgi:NitT/TauT family transport system permease protein
MWSALFAAAILAAGLIVIVGLIERGLARRMGVRQ